MVMVLTTRLTESLDPQSRGFRSRLSLGHPRVQSFGLQGSRD